MNYTLYRKLVLICFSNESEYEPIEREKPIPSNNIIKVIVEKEDRIFYENIDFEFQILDVITFNSISENTKPKLKLM